MRVPLQIDWLSDQNRVQNHTCSVFVVRHDNKLTDRQCSMSLALSPQSTQRTLIFVRRSSLANSYIMIIGWKTIICWLLVKTEKKKPYVLVGGMSREQVAPWSTHYATKHMSHCCGCCCCCCCWAWQKRIHWELFMWRQKHSVDTHHTHTVSAT